MTKPKIKQAINLKGFYLVKDYLTPNEEQHLVNSINQMPWTVDYQRRLQYYNYRNELFKPFDLIPIPNKIPPFLEDLIDKLLMDKIIDEKPDQIIINEYLPGEGLKPHFDRKSYFKNVIVGISLESGITMEFTSTKLDPPEKKKIYLPRRSVYVMKDDARNLWKHGIPGRKSDIVDGISIPRSKRISITFRTVNLSKVKFDNIAYPNRFPNEKIDK